MPTDKSANRIGSRSASVRREKSSLKTAKLSERHVYVVSALFYDSKTQEEVSTELGISQARVSQLCSEALKRLEAAGLPTPVKPPAPRLLFYPLHAIEHDMEMGSSNQWVIPKNSVLKVRGFKHG